MTAGAAIALVVAILLVPIGGLFACVDSALARVSKARVDEFVREEVGGAKALAAIVADRPRYTNLLLMLRVACELTATVLVAIAARTVFGTRWPVALLVVVVMIVISYAVIGVGPRTLGLQHVNRVALTSAPAVRLLGRMFNPLAALLTLFGNAITPGRGLRDGPFASEVELRELVDMAEERGVVEADERQMIQSVFELGNTIAREVMVPRTEVVWIEKVKSVRQALALALRSGFSRVPVVGENADDVVGVVYLKDLARRAQDTERARGTTVEEVMRAVTYVPESKRVDALLREMQAARSHIAVVIDEYGGTAGLITIEDILEEIVGEITDEYDVERPPIEKLVEDEHEVAAARVTARLAVEDLAELFDIEIPHRDDVETVGGLLAEALGRVPIAGSVAVVHGLELRADEIGGRRNRVDSIVATRVVEPGGDAVAAVAAVAAGDAGRAGDADRAGDTGRTTDEHETAAPASRGRP
ncbi:Hemolysin, contains CBS domains [Jatrophihabitans endophyticus]|uniref:Hemolysin, contains CBS domains n=1 Tax=Jatrophihabitans endophyticus TaxID=1206085 RepID=A0A1M5KFR6_9ACTN|nr:hemolysin family protein [Jatrophihabitans endophyticus]SHG51339.1 Hemolysin, contains CBS domains [Jatrophihabitans endophyticus]